MLKFFELEGRFPQFVEEFPQAAVDYVAGVVKVPAEDLAKYGLSSRSAKGHRTQIRETLGYRPATRADEERLTAWLADEVCPVEMVEDRLREALLVQCRSDHVEPPGRVERIVAAARARADRVFCAQTVARLGEACAGRLLTLVAEGNEEGTALLASLKRDPGAVGLDSLLAEITKLTAVRRLGLPEGLFADCSEKLVAAWAGAGDQDVSLGLPGRWQGCADHAAGGAVRVPAGGDHRCPGGAAGRSGSHKINARAERRVERQLTAELKKVRGKEGILFQLADASVGQPEGTVRRVLFPVVGEKTLRDLVAEANEKAFKARVRTTLRSSYSSYYPADAAVTAADARLQVQQHRLPAGDGRARAAGEVRRRRRQDPLLRRRRRGADGRPSPQGLA